MSFCQSGFVDMSWWYSEVQGFLFRKFWLVDDMEGECMMLLLLMKMNRSIYVDIC